MSRQKFAMRLLPFMSAEIWGSVKRHLSMDAAGVEPEDMSLAICSEDPHSSLACTGPSQVTGFARPATFYSLLQTSAVVNHRQPFNEFGKARHMVQEAVLIASSLLPGGPLSCRRLPCITCFSFTQVQKTQCTGSKDVKGAGCSCVIGR